MSEEKSSENLELLQEFTHTFDKYSALVYKSRLEAIAHVSKNFSFKLAASVKSSAHPKGELKSMLENVAASSGLRIHAAARASGLRKAAGKKLGGYQIRALMVKDEIASRERARTFSLSAARFKGDFKTGTTSTRDSKTAGATRVIHSAEGEVVEFNWGSELGKISGAAAVGLSNYARRGAFQSALRAVTTDMQEYYARKNAGFARKSGRSL